MAGGGGSLHKKDWLKLGAIAAASAATGGAAAGLLGAGAGAGAGAAGLGAADAAAAGAAGAGATGAGVGAAEGAGLGATGGLGASSAVPELAADSAAAAAYDAQAANAAGLAMGPPEGLANYGPAEPNMFQKFAANNPNLVKNTRMGLRGAYYANQVGQMEQQQQAQQRAAMMQSRPPSYGAPAPTNTVLYPQRQGLIGGGQATTAYGGLPPLGMDPNDPRYRQWLAMQQGGY